MKLLLFLIPAIGLSQSLPIAAPLLDLSKSTQVIPFPFGGTLPTTGCLPNSFFNKTGGSAGLYINSGTGSCVWTIISGGSGSVGPINSVQTGDGAGGLLNGGCTMTSSVLNCGTNFGAGGACIAPGSVSTPSAGSVNYFCDSTNSNHLSAKISSGTTVDIQAGGGGGQALTRADQGLWLGGGPPTSTIPKVSVTASTPIFYGNPNPFASFKISSISVVQYSASGNAKMAIADDQCNILGSSNTLALSGTSGYYNFVFASPVTITTPYFYVGLVVDTTISNLFAAIDSASGEMGNLINTGVTTPQVFTGSIVTGITFGSTCGIRTASTPGNTDQFAAYARP